MDAAIHVLTFLPPATDALATLSPAARAWFCGIGEPTAVQRGAFGVVVREKSALLSAPTGTGKTLAAFLPLLDRLANPPVGRVCDPAEGEPALDTTSAALSRVTDPAYGADGIIGIVITPLKALAADQFKNLSPLVDSLAPHVRLGMRTGDTSAAERRQMKVTPPHLLWTTPESLAVLLTQDVFRHQVKTLRWVVVDEVHALAARKRGADLTLSLERLEELTHAGPLQRVGLSATCDPLETAARFLVGSHRPCEVVHVPHDPDFELAIEPLPRTSLAGFATRVVDRLLPELAANRTTLIFANTRNVCERIGWALKRRLPQKIDEIAIHHSSLAPERRREIEADLKAGKLAAVVSSASLELGIDIGSVDGVVFVHPPGGVSRLLQRLGRAGHRPNTMRRGLLLCGHPSEILEAAVTAASGRLRQIEPIDMPEAPLDVLCQQLVGMSIGRAWTRKSAFELCRRAFPYQDLSQDDFDACLRYLRGQKPDGEEWLPPRLDRIDELYSITSRRTAKLMERNLGVIVTDDPTLVRTEGDDGIVLGELDENYATTLQAGDRFLLGGRCLTIVRIESRDIVVRETPGAPLVPHWGNSGTRLAEELARRLYLVRADAAEFVRDGAAAIAGYLRRELDLGPRAVAELAGFLHAQETVSEIPHGRAVLVEVVDRGFGFEYALHVPLHAAGSEALARVLQERMRREFGGKVTSAAVTLGVILFHETDLPLGDEAWRRMMSASDFASEIDAIVRTSDLTRTKFADVARIGLMALRSPLGGTRKVGGRDWIERRLFDRILDGDPDFALLRQARRETLATTCAGDAALRYLNEIADLPLVVRPLTETSPIAAAWLDAGEEAAHKQWHEAG